MTILMVSTKLVWCSFLVSNTAPINPNLWTINIFNPIKKVNFFQNFIPFLRDANILCTLRLEIRWPSSTYYGYFFRVIFAKVLHLNQDLFVPAYVYTTAGSLFFSGLKLSQRLFTVLQDFLWKVHLRPVSWRGREVLALWWVAWFKNIRLIQQVCSAWQANKKHLCWSCSRYGCYDVDVCKQDAKRVNTQDLCGFAFWDRRSCFNYRETSAVQPLSVSTINRLWSL